MRDRPVILAIDDEPRLCDVLTRSLKSECSIHTASSGQEGLAQLDVLAPDLILLDLNMPQMSGMAVLQRLRKAGNYIPVIILTAYGSVDSAVRAIKLGAVDYLEKPLTEEKLRQTVKAFFAKRNGNGIDEIASRRDIIGESPQIRKVWQLVERYGPTDLPIILYGETGTGKELFARSLHEIGKRQTGPFVPVDVSTIPESLVESEIFGYERGAFTDAKGSKPGRLEWAHGGTLFLDEIGNLPLSCQVKLLRVLQEDRYVPLGGRASKTVDIRLVSATNSDLKAEIQRGAFREDLYYRIDGVTIELPPLRERKGDIEILTHHFIEKYREKYERPPVEISDEAMDLLLSYRWPGNVRELEHTIARATVIADRVILPQHLSLRRLTETHECLGVSRLSSNNSDAKEIIVDLNVKCDLTQKVDLKGIKEKVAAEVERLIITEAKKKLCVKQMELAEFLSIDPKTLRSKMKRNDNPCCR
ncbi:MAG: sigma-54-dependent Fis family transcriptional regulator [Candidatus Latescibacteria bacterium]|nr:sigma-54-dependent Fis family transcriptional regulator [Candidatus Latescibacterota bacterium]